MTTISPAFHRPTALCENAQKPSHPLSPLERLPKALLQQMGSFLDLSSAFQLANASRTIRKMNPASGIKEVKLTATHSSPKYAQRPFQNWNPKIGPIQSLTFSGLHFSMEFILKICACHPTVETIRLDDVSLCDQFALEDWPQEESLALQELRFGEDELALPKLKKLHASWSHVKVYYLILDLLEHNHQITNLSIGNRSMPTSGQEGISNLITNCKELTHLSIEDVSDQTLEKIDQICPELTHLTLAFCDHLKREAIEKIAEGKHFKNLTHLNITFVQGTSNQEQFLGFENEERFRQESFTFEGPRNFLPL